ncbi:MAG: hypothetical protein IT477_10725 [Rhodanobacteraceae bacterium]|nr:hypothetical protein [Rhodanobacteraceae bacterium]
MSTYHSEHPAVIAVCQAQHPKPSYHMRNTTAATLNAIVEAGYWIVPAQPAIEIRTCRVCGCTDDDCSQCVEKTGDPCYWVADDLCSACAQVTL